MNSGASTSTTHRKRIAPRNSGSYSFCSPRLIGFRSSWMIRCGTRSIPASTIHPIAIHQRYGCVSGRRSGTKYSAAAGRIIAASVISPFARHPHCRGRMRGVMK